MTAHKILWPMLALLAAACAPKPAPMVATEPAPTVTAPPAALATSEPEPALDTAAVVAAQRNLRALGYNPGKSGDLGDPALARAIIAFEKDQGLPQGGTLTSVVIEKLKLVRAAMLKTIAADAGRSGTFIYSDGVVRKQALGLIAPPPEGLISDAAANFLLPLHPGAQGSFQFGSRAKDGSAKAAMTITCVAGKMTPTNVPLGLQNAIPVDCRGTVPNAPQWRSVYSTALGMVVRQDTISGVHDLVAIRPFTGDWPSAARMGLDWALTHALEAGAPGAPVQWSSTGVAAHFEIRALAKLSGQDAGLSGKYAALPCRRFEMVQAGTPALHYPAIACQTAPGIWSLPGSVTPFAAPGNGIAARTLPAALQNLRN